MTLRVKVVLIVFITVIVAVLIGAGISIFNFYKKSKAPVSEIQTVVNRQTEEPSVQNILETPLPVQTQEPPRIAPQEMSPEDRARGIIAGIVPSFVETFGSYSNQSGFENMEHLLPFMTPAMETWAQTQIDKARSKPMPEIYKGVTTMTKNHTIQELDLEQGEALVLVETKRKELVGESTNFATKDQNILIRMKKNNGVWLVDGAFWQ